MATKKNARKVRTQKPPARRTTKTARQNPVKKKHGETMNHLVAGQKVKYAQVFVLNVVAYALAHTNQEAAAFFDLPVRTIENWRKQMKQADTKAMETLSPSSRFNPYRGMPYSIERRLALSDKLFAELEKTAEIEVTRHGYIPAEILHKLIIGYSILTDKRRLEEGVHTDLIASIRDPRQIEEEGEAKVLSFRKRYSLPSGD